MTCEFWNFAKRKVIQNGVRRKWGESHHPTQLQYKSTVTARLNTLSEDRTRIPGQINIPVLLPVRTLIEHCRMCMTAVCWQTLRKLWSKGLTILMTSTRNNLSAVMCCVVTWWKTRKCERQPSLWHWRRQRSRAEDWEIATSRAREA
jgi:hypothetical protein